MKAPLTDDSWTRRGISVLWDAESLARLCQADQVIPLSQLFALHEVDWPDEDMPLVNDRALVVAGLDVAIDALVPIDAQAWLEQKLYPVVHSFQNDFADGGGAAALILWMSEQRRWHYHTSEESYLWHCSTAFKGETLALGRCLWNGAESALRRIENTEDEQPRWIGLFNSRIS